MICPKCNGTGEVSDPKQIGEKLKSLREDKMSIAEMARRLGISGPFLSDMEKGRRNIVPYQDRILRILENETATRH